MELAGLDFSKEYTYADYLEWTFEERLELIKGKPFEMGSTPGRIHQKLSMKIVGELSRYLRGKSYQAYAAPFDVRLPQKSKSDQDIMTVVQPDICVICDCSKLDDNGCLGAPDIIVEILSPGNNKKELKDKYEVYEVAGVQEYWLVFPVEEAFLQYIREDGRFITFRPLTEADVVTTPILPGFELNLNELFRVS